MEHCKICADYPNLIGAFIVRHGSSSPNDIVEIPIEVKFCPNCGAELHDLRETFAVLGYDK